jgi:hypothetical protein
MARTLSISISNKHGSLHRAMSTSTSNDEYEDQPAQLRGMQLTPLSYVSAEREVGSYIQLRSYREESCLIVSGYGAD